MATAQHLLAQTLTLPNGSTLPNRLAKSALSETLGTMDNRVTPALVRLYERWAKGGTGLAGDYGSTLSYVGIGYTGQSLRGGWGFSADLGLAVSGLADGLRLNRSALSLDEGIRAGRYQAVLQLGLSYRF